MPQGIVQVPSLDDIPLKIYSSVSQTFDCWDTSGVPFFSRSEMGGILLSLHTPKDAYNLQAPPRHPLCNSGLACSVLLPDIPPTTFAQSGAVQDGNQSEISLGLLAASGNPGTCSIPWNDVSAQEGGD